MIHGLVLWGLILADGPHSASPVQEIAVELVTGVPGEKDGKGANVAAEADKPPAKEQPQQARDAQRRAPEGTDERREPPSPQAAGEHKAAQQEPARTEPQRAPTRTGSAQPKPQLQAKPSPPVQMPFFLFPDQSRMGATAARAPGADEKNAKWREIVLGMLVAKKDRLEELARSRGANGSVAIAFSVDDGGAIDNIELMRGSGQAELDAEALTMVREAAPFPPPPAGAIRKFAPIIAFGG